MQHKLHTLKNGTRVVFVPQKDTISATISAFYAVGSRYEALKQWGASHFIEHMMFKGTEKRPTSLHISRELDGVGADYNAYTSKDTTTYYIRLRADKLPLAIDLLEDMIYHSKFGEKEVDSERGAIGEEIRMYEDNPVMVVDEMLEEELFAGSTLARKIAGTVGSLAKIGSKELLDYRGQYYVPSRTVVAVAGNFDEEKVLEQLEKTFGAVAEPKKKARTFTEYDAKDRKGSGRTMRVNVQQKETEQIQLALGFPSYPMEHPKMPALYFLAHILGGTMSSRLFIEVREKRGLAYSVRSGLSPYQDIGCFVIQAGLAKGRVDEALKVIAKELGIILKKPVGKEELRRAKENMKGRIALSFEDSSNLADWYGRKLLLQNKVVSLEEYIVKMEKVTAEDIMKVAKEIFREKNLCIAAIGQIEKPELLLKPFANIG